MATREQVVLMMLLSCLLLLQRLNLPAMVEYTQIHHQMRLLMIQMMDTVKRKRHTRKVTHRRFWIKPGQTAMWWDNFLNGIVLEQEWKENFRMSPVNFSI